MVLSKGTISYRTLPASILKTLQRYIPSLLVLNKELPETNNDFQFNFQLEDTELFSKVFKIPVELYMPATLNGYFMITVHGCKLEVIFQHLFTTTHISNQERYCVITLQMNCNAKCV